MRGVPLAIAFLSACSGVSKAPPVASHTAAPAVATANAGTAEARQAAGAVQPGPVPPGNPTSPTNEQVAPAEPTVSAKIDSENLTEWTLEARGFPAISKDGKLAALAFGELQTTGPPVLVLTLELRSIDTGRTLQTASFRHAYTGELSKAELAALRKRLTEWVNSENAARSVHRRGRRNSEDHAAASGRDPRENTARRSSERSSDREPRSRKLDGDGQEQSVRQLPIPTVLTGVFMDDARRALVIRADYCSPGDLCAEGVPPRFTVQRLP